MIIRGFVCIECYEVLLQGISSMTPVVELCATSEQVIRFLRQQEGVWGRPKQIGGQALESDTIVTLITDSDVTDWESVALQVTRRLERGLDVVVRYQDRTSRYIWVQCVSAPFAIVEFQGPATVQ